MELYNKRVLLLSIINSNNTGRTRKKSVIALHTVTVCYVISLTREYAHIYLPLCEKYYKYHYHVSFSDVWLHTSAQKISSVILFNEEELYLTKICLMIYRTFKGSVQYVLLLGLVLTITWFKSWWLKFCLSSGLNSAGKIYHKKNH